MVGGGRVEREANRWSRSEEGKGLSEVCLSRFEGVFSRDDESWTVC